MKIRWEDVYRTRFQVMAEMQKSQGHHIFDKMHNTCFSLHLHAFYEQVKKIFISQCLHLTISQFYQNYIE
jgi:hypothetical protein